MSDEVRSTCPYCGVGCGVIVRSAGRGADRRVIEVRGDPQHPANFGRLCTKGATLLQAQDPTLARPARLLHPMRRDARDAPHRRIGWDDALDDAADRFAQSIREHGPDSVAFYVSGQLLTEDYYAFNKLARAVVGTNHIDSNSRLCMSSAVAGYRRTLGADAPPACYEDIDHAGCLFVTGSNLAWAHPIVARRIEEARARDPALRMVVVDPRRTDTAAMADLHLPLLPGTDVALLHGMLHVMLWEGWVDRPFVAAHTTGFDALRDVVRDTTPAWAAEVCGLEVEAIVTAARWFATAGPTLSLYCQGLNQSVVGTAKNAALIGLHLATGQIGRPGAGPLSLTGQPNAMGGRETGSMANLLPGHRDPAEPADRDEVARYWGIDTLPSRPGHTAVPMFEALARGEIRCLWIACTNPVQSMPATDTVRDALRRAEFVVLQEAYAGTATAPFADLWLPATGWPEKDGTVTNSERRISRVRAATPAPGEARADWAIAADLAGRLQARLGRVAHGFDWAGPQDVWNEYRGLTAGRDLDITGLSWDLLDRDGPQQWPFPPGARAGRTRLYADRAFATADGRARFAAERDRPVAEGIDARHPLRLLTGRARDAWHGGSRTGLVPRLFAHDPEPVLRMAPADLQRRAIAEGSLVTVRSRRGAIVLPACGDDGLRPGQVWLPMHWGPEWLAGGVNRLTLAATDPVSRQPELKHAAVAVERTALPHRLVAIGRVPPGRLVATRRALQPLFEAAAYGCCVPFGRDDTGLVLRIADGEPLDPRLPADVAAIFGVPPHALLRYEDPRGDRRRWLAVDDRRLHFVLLSGEGVDEAAERRLHRVLLEGGVVGSLSSLLAPGAGGAPDDAPRPRTVCSCVGVTDAQILAFVARTGDRRLDAVQSALSCGSGCGSCRGEVARLAATAPGAPARAA